MCQRSHIWIRRVISANICISSAHWREIHAAFTALLTFVHGSIFIFHWAGNFGGRQRGGRTLGTLQRGQTVIKRCAVPQRSSAKHRKQNRLQDRRLNKCPKIDIMTRWSAVLRKTLICLCVCRRLLDCSVLCGSVKATELDSPATNSHGNRWLHLTKHGTLIIPTCYSLLISTFNNAHRGGGSKGGWKVSFSPASRKR